MNTFALQMGHNVTFWINALMLTVIVVSFIGSSLNYRYKSYKLKEKEKGEAVDAIIEDGKDNIVLIRRRYPPYQGMSALPGGFIEKEREEEDEDAVIREVKEETGLEVKVTKKAGVFDKKDRDPRDRIVSNVFKCRVIRGKLDPGDDAYEPRWVSIEIIKDLELAFDHKQMLKKAGYDL